MAAHVLGDPWNPVTGCSKISPGCRHCYALERFIPKFQEAGVACYASGGALTCHPDRLVKPKKRRKPTTYFVDSMGDLFHKDVQLDFIKEVFAVMEAYPHHTFQVLTKRSDRLAHCAPTLPWSNNIWMGVSVENMDYAYRIDDLRKVPTKVRFIMFEPLLARVGTLDLTGIDWAVAGGESGESFRPMNLNWVREIRDQCLPAGVKFTFKQYAGKYPPALGRMLDGREWNERP